MKVLLTHNYYGSANPSGENQVFEAERKLLEKNNHEVFQFTRHSDVIRSKGLWGLMQGSFSTPWNFFAALEIQRKVKFYQPDVVHVHNTFPLLSPAIFYAIGYRAARVLTLHNYRLFCPAGIPSRGGEICTDCMNKHSVMPAIQHCCYRNSRLATFPLAANVALHRLLGTWTQQVDGFITLSEFQREWFVKLGIPAELLHVKPNFYPSNPISISWEERQLNVVFVGRLTKEKGLTTLLKAWILWGSSAPELCIVGDGELRAELEELAATSPDVPIRFLGMLDSAAAQSEIANARLLVLPSEWFEGLPMVLIEAFAHGTPVIASNIGSLSAIVQHGDNGMLFEMGNSYSLFNAVRNVWMMEGELEHLSAGARITFDTLYSEEYNYVKLMNIYKEAIAVNIQRRRCSGK